MAPASGFPALIESFFVDRLLAQRHASPRTVASYRDTFRLFLSFAASQIGRAPATLSFDNIDAPLVLGFLEHLETTRGNSARSRNQRLAALRSFARYASLLEPACLSRFLRILAIPTKRFDRPLVEFLTREEIQAILAAPDRCKWNGRRDRALFATLYNTGARVSESTALRRRDLDLAPVASVRLEGKGRKERRVPLWKTTATLLRAWLHEIPADPLTPAFPNGGGHALSRSGVERRLRLAIALAARTCPSLEHRHVSPHTLRHTTAMHLLQSGVDLTVIALWLGHESPVTTHQYLDADLEMKKRALDRVAPPTTQPGRRIPRPDRLLAFLEAL